MEKSAGGKGLRGNRGNIAHLKKKTGAAMCSPRGGTNGAGALLQEI